MAIIGAVTKKLEQVAVALPQLIGVFRFYYKEVVAREILLGSICAKDQVLCIGGGPLPCTAIEIAQETGAIVQVVDNDYQAVDDARKVIEKLGLAEQIKVECVDGREVDASKYNVIHVALQVKCHEQILKHIWAKAPQGARILMRSPLEKLQAFYTALPRNCQFAEGNNKACGLIEQANCTMRATQLFIKESRVKSASEENSVTPQRAAIDSRASLVG